MVACRELMAAKANLPNDMPLDLTCASPDLQFNLWLLFTVPLNSEKSLISRVPVSQFTRKSTSRRPRKWIIRMVLSFRSFWLTQACCSKFTSQRIKTRSHKNRVTSHLRISWLPPPQTIPTIRPNSTHISRIHKHKHNPIKYRLTSAKSPWYRN